MRLLAIVAGTVVTFSTVCSGFGQAVAEGAMVHAHAATTGVKVGSALGNALSKATRHNAESMEAATGAMTTAGTIQNVPKSSAQAMGSGDASGPLVITSIQGAHKPCAARPTTPTNPGQTSSPAAPASAAATPATPVAAAPAVPTTAAAAPAPSSDCASAAGAQTQYKSSIQLSFPK